MFKKILIANDGSGGAFKALTTALQLAHSYKARAHMICVDEVSWVQVRLQEEVINEKEIADRKFTDIVAKAEAEAKHRGVELVTHIVIGRPAPPSSPSSSGTVLISSSPASKATRRSTT